MFLNRNSIRFRLTALFVLIFGSTLVLFSGLLYRTAIQSHQTAFDLALYNHAVDVIQAIEVDLFGDLSLRNDILSDSKKVLPFSLGKVFLEIRHPDGKIMARSRALGALQLPYDPQEFEGITQNGAHFQTILIPNNFHSYRLITYLIAKPPAPRLILQIAAPLTVLEQERIGLLTFFTVSIPLILLIATLGGLFLSRRALAPVSAIIAKTTAITASQLSERVPVPEAEDELQQLALTLNDLLDRLQKAFESQERFIADASHQLKTPLSILRGELDVLTSRNRRPEEMVEFIKSASQEIDHLSRMVEDLLLLARVDAGEKALVLQPLRFDEIALESVSRLETPARAKNIKIRFNLVGTGTESETPDFETHGDADLLRCMIHNLVENAIKFSPEGTSIDVTVVDRHDSLSVSVKDEGPGIPEDQLATIFQRFYRVEIAKAKVPGVGLGLSIVQRIAQIHSGSVEVNSTLGMGTLFTARIKKL